MTLSRWKLIASALVLGTGGLAVFAMPPSEKGKPLPAPTSNTTQVAELPPLLPVPKADGTDTKTSPKPVSTPAEFDLLVPTLPAKAKTEATETAPSPIKPVKFEPVPEPLKGTEEIPGTKLPPLPSATGDKTPSAPLKTEPATPPLPPSDPFAPIKPIDNKEPMKVPEIPGVTLPPAPPKPMDNKAPEKLPDPKLPTLPDTAPPPLKGVEPMLPSFPDTPAPPMKLVPTTPPTKVEPLPPLGVEHPQLPMKLPDPKPMTPPDFPMIKPDVPFDTPKVGGDIKPIEAKTSPDHAKQDLSKLKMLVRLDAGSPRFEIRNTSIDELLLKVSGNKIEMQNTDAKSTLVGVSSSGSVKFSGPGIEGTCDQLTIISATGEVMMKGNVKLKSKHGRNWSEITSDKMVYQIGAAGLVPAKTTGTLTGVDKQR